MDKKIIVKQKDKRTGIIYVYEGKLIYDKDKKKTVYKKKINPIFSAI